MARSDHPVETNLQDLGLGKVEESGVIVLACRNSFSPRKTDLYYNKELILERLLITNLLSEYVKRGKSVLKPVRCLDARGGVGINGLLWQKYISDGIKVCIATPYSSAINTISENATMNGLNIDIVHKDPCVLLHEEAFNFIHIDCHTSASHYLDAAFKNLPRNGVLVITTKDDSSLYGRNPDAALRNYGGIITKTFYGTELAIRLVIAAMARSAAKYSKAINVLCTAAFKNSFMIAVTTTKGPLKANKALQDIRRLLHCNMCEERAFFPVSELFLIDNPTSLLSCNCHLIYPGRVIMELGPVWAGEIFDADYLSAMMQHDNIPSRKLLNVFISQLLSETMLPTSVLQCNQNNINEPPPNKLIKLDDNKEEKTTEENCYKPVTPPFYYNLPRHSPKGPHLLPIDKVVQALIKAGYKASRTHFDREAVRTNANAKQLMNVIQSCIEKS